MFTKEELEERKNYIGSNGLPERRTPKAIWMSLRMAAQTMALPFFPLA